ncbi:uncharacterized protein LOC119350605 [Triticum dicoccoides]|uniref:uncharacterized protein LOC119350605 n=1 Tax=Triticum dicoccoides TaxID=85692 RepID=UPI0018902959|nr:uncharacterized protein LOC119350605 [Triticum dicoccoides]
MPMCPPERSETTHLPTRSPHERSPRPLTCRPNPASAPQILVPLLPPTLQGRHSPHCFAVAASHEIVVEGAAGPDDCDGEREREREGRCGVEGDSTAIGMRRRRGRRAAVIDSQRSNGCRWGSTRTLGTCSRQ